MKSLIPLLCVFLATSVSAQTSVSARAFMNTKDGCYTVYTDTKDRVIIGCPVPGYHTNYEFAHGTRTNMYLFRNDEDERGKVTVFFAVSTLDFRGRTLEELFREDLDGISGSNPSFKITTIDPPRKTLPKCLFAVIETEAPMDPLPYQTMALCRSESSESALLFITQTKDRRTAKDNEDSFVAWINTHKLHKADVIVGPKGVGIGIK